MEDFKFNWLSFILANVFGFLGFMCLNIAFPNISLRESLCISFAIIFFYWFQRFGEDTYN